MEDQKGESKGRWMIGGSSEGAGGKMATGWNSLHRVCCTNPWQAGRSQPELTYSLDISFFFTTGSGLAPHWLHAWMGPFPLGAPAAL